MSVEIKPVSFEEKEILNNLLEKYNYEFSQYDKIPFNDDGLYGYRYLDSYWTDDGRLRILLLLIISLQALRLLTSILNATEKLIGLLRNFLFHTIIETKVWQQ